MLVHAQKFKVELFVFRLEVIFVLVDSFISNHLQVLCFVCGWVSHIIFNELRMLGLFKPGSLGLDHANVSSFVVGLGIEGSSVLELEDFLFEVRGLVVFRRDCVALLEVVLVEAVLVVAQELLSVQEFFDSLVFSVVFEVGLEVVSVFLFFFGQFACENCV